MKAKNVIVALLSLSIIFGCDDIENMIKFNINDRTAIRIESASLLDLPLEIPTPDVTSNSQQQYENNNTHAGLIKDVKLEQLELSITHPETKTFSFLKSIKIYISSEGSEEIELASLENIQSSATTLKLAPTTQKLDVYVRASAYTLRTEAITRETLTESVDIDVDVKFLVTANTF